MTTLARTRLSRVCKVFLLQVDISQIMVDEGDEPNPLVDLFGSEALSSEDAGDIDFLAMQADAATGGDEDVGIVEGVLEVGRP